jgi:hypothetical protein
MGITNESCQDADLKASIAFSWIFLAYTVYKVYRYEIHF